MSCVHHLESLLPAGRQIEALLTERLDQSGTFRAVAVAGEGVRGNLLLAEHLEEIYHDATQVPGSARVTLTAELIDTGRRRLVGRRKSSASVPVPSYDAAGTVAGCRQALGLVLDQVVARRPVTPPDPGARRRVPFLSATFDALRRCLLSSLRARTSR